MLTADKNATVTNFQIKIYEIREKELNYFISLYLSISGMAAFLAGFAYSALSSKLPEDTNFLLKLLFLCITASCVGLEICAMTNATTCCVFGPGMFLRGAGGLEAAEKAVKVLHDKSETTITIFMWGLIGIIMSSSLRSFILFTFMDGVMISLGLALTLFVIFTYVCYANREEDIYRALRSQRDRDHREN